MTVAIKNYCTIFFFRLMSERESLGKQLEQLTRKHNLLKASRNADSNEVRDLAEQIESAHANMEYIQVG